MTFAQLEGGLCMRATEGINLNALSALSRMGQAHAKTARGGSGTQ